MQSNCVTRRKGENRLDNWQSVLHELTCKLQNNNAKLKGSDKKPHLSLEPFIKNCVGSFLIEPLG